MNAPEKETHMATSPEGQTQMAGKPEGTEFDTASAPAAKTKAARKVHIRAIKPIEIKDPVRDAEGKVVAETRVLEAGQTAYVTEAEAKLFCDTETKGYPSFTGERPDNEIPKEKFFRAVRVTGAVAQQAAG